MKIQLLMKAAFVGSAFLAVPAMSQAPAAPAATPAPAQQVVAPAATVAPAPAPAGAPAPVAPAAEQAPAAPAAAPVAPAPAPEVAAPVSAPAPEVAAPAPVVTPAPAPAPQVAAPTPAPETPKAAKKVAKTPKKVEKKAEKEQAVITFPAKIDIQGKKVLWNKTEDPDGNNLEQWFGRATISMLAKTSDFEGKFTIRAIPADFGGQMVITTPKDTTFLDTTKIPQYLTGSTTPYGYRDSISQRDGIVNKESRQNYDKFEIYEAYTLYKTEIVDVKMGRYLSNDRAGYAFGNYADEKAGAQFMPAGKSVNAFEISKSLFSSLSFRMALESSDPNLNKGDLRIGMKFADLSSISWLKLGVNYRSNLFDVVKDPDATVKHNGAATVEIPLGGWRIFGEAGFRGMDSDGEIDEMPISGGVEVPAGRILDKVIFEAEWNKDREEKNGTAKEVLGSVFIQKKLGDRFAISFGVQNNDQTEDFAMIGRLTGTIN